MRRLLARIGGENDPTRCAMPFDSGPLDEDEIAGAADQLFAGLEVEETETGKTDADTR